MYLPQSPFGQCWPHIIRKFALEGQYAKKTWQYFEQVVEHLRSIHLASTPDMRDLLIGVYGTLWDKWGASQMRKFHNSYCVEPWNCWSNCFDAPLCTPSQQAQESWHKLLLKVSTANTPNVPCIPMYCLRIISHVGVLLAY